MSDGPRSAAEQRDQIQQQSQGQTGYGSGSDDFAQPGKTGNNENGASMGQDAAEDMNDDGDVAGSAAGATTGSDMAQGDQAGYGSNPQQSGMMNDSDSRSAIGGQQQSEVGEDSLDDEDFESESDIDDGSSAASSAGAM